MADLTGIQLVRNDGAAWTKTAGAASQTIVMNRSDEKIMLLIENGDAAACRVKFTAQEGDDLDVDVAAGEFAVVGVLESAKFKIDGKVTAQILDQDDTAFSGTVGNVLLTQLNAPKGVTN